MRSGGPCNGKIEHLSRLFVSSSFCPSSSLPPLPLLIDQPLPPTTQMESSSQPGSSSSRPPSVRRFSFSSARSSITKSLGHNSDHPPPLPPPPSEAAYSHRPLHSLARGSKPPTTGPSSSRTSRSNTPSSSSNMARTQPQRASMPSEFSNLIGNVKRSLSLSRKASREQPHSAPSSNVSLAVVGSQSSLGS